MFHFSTTKIQQKMNIKTKDFQMVVSNQPETLGTETASTFLTIRIPRSLWKYSIF